MIDNFDHILGENEKIIKAFKPNKFKLGIKSLGKW